MNARELYALALHLVPDLNVAGDLFMASRDEADLRRRAVAWRRAQGLPPVASDELVLQLDAAEAAHALHLAQRSRRRRVIRWSGWFAFALVLVLAVPLFRRAIAVGAADPDQVLVRPISGEPIADVTRCGDGHPELRRGSRPGEYQLRLSIPYSPKGPEPRIAFVGLPDFSVSADPAWVFVDIRAEWARPGSTACYRTVTALQFPQPLWARQIQFEINLSPERGGGMRWLTGPVVRP